MSDIRVTKDGGKIWTAKYIPKNSFFGPYERNLAELARTTDEEDTEFSLTEEELNESKQMETQQQNWLCLIKCARKPDEQNLEAIRAPNEIIYVKSTRDISPGEVLGLWFGSSLAKEMGIEEAEYDNKQGNSWLCTRCCRSFKYQRTLLIHKRFECCKPSSKDRCSVPTNSDRHPVNSEKEDLKPTMDDTRSNTEDKRSSSENPESRSNAEERFKQKTALDEVHQREDSESAKPKKGSTSHETEILDVKMFLLKGTFATPFQCKMNADIESKCNEALKGLKEHLSNTAARENNFLKNLEPMEERRSSTSLPHFDASVTGHDYHVNQKSKFSSLLTLLSSRPRPTKSMEEKSLAEFHKKEFRKKFQGNEHYLRKHLYRGRARNSDAPMGQEKISAFTTHFGTSSLFRLNSGTQFSFPESFKEEKASALHCYSGRNIKYPFFGPNLLPQESSLKIDKSSFHYRHYLSQPALRPQISRFSEPIRCEDYVKYNIAVHRSAFGPYVSSRNKRLSTDSKLLQDSNEKYGDAVIDVETEDFLKRSKARENKGYPVTPPAAKELQPADSRFFGETNLRPSTPVNLFTNRKELNSDDVKTDDRKSPQDNEFDSVTNQISSKFFSWSSDWKKNRYSEPGLVQHIPKTFDSGEDICYHDYSAHAQSHELSHQNIPAYPILLDNKTPKDSIHFDLKTSLPSIVHSFLPRPQLLPLMTPRIVDHVSTTPSRDQGFMCEFCGKVYCRKYVLKIHMRTHTGFKPLHCKVCDKSFSDPSNMKKHVKLHETEHTVHKCKHCGRNFVRYRGLLNHIKAKHSQPSGFGYY